MIRVAPAPVEDELYVRNLPVRLTAHDWALGERALDAVVVRRLSATHLKLRLVEGGAFVAAHQADVQLRPEV